jgi:energy-coupling factor transporter ATP-binding protein EcfA2
MAEKGGVYVLDEPTTGLHLADVEQLLGLLGRLVDSGKSVIVIEHDQAVMGHAEWIIDLGPGAGHDGGRIVFEGTPAGPTSCRYIKSEEREQWMRTFVWWAVLLTGVGLGGWPGISATCRSNTSLWRVRPASPFWERSSSAAPFLPPPS